MKVGGESVSPLYYIRGGGGSKLSASGGRLTDALNLPYSLLWRVRCESSPPMHHSTPQ